MIIKGGTESCKGMALEASGCIHRASAVQIKARNRTKPRRQPDTDTATAISGFGVNSVIASGGTACEVHFNGQTQFVLILARSLEYFNFADF